jgi:probable phosphoglycerate mutase
MRLIVVRHAETNYNVEGLVNYDPLIDVHLTEKGIKQAKELAEVLKDTTIDLIITSRLKRTKQTAEILNRYHNAPVIEDCRLDDTYNGYEGKKVAELKAFRDSYYDPVNAKKSDEWESVRDVNARIRNFLDDIKKRPEQTILIVTSSHPIKHFRIINENRPIEEALAGHYPNAKPYEINLI